MTAKATHITPEFKKVAVEVARHYNIADVEEWEDLPEGVRRFMDAVQYKALVAPLILRDRCELSWTQLSIKYKLSYQEVRTICKKQWYRARIRAAK